MAEQGKPQVSSFTKFFVPGLAIGLVVGGLGGAYFSSRLDAPPLPALKPHLTTTPPTAHPTGRPEDEAATGPTASTGPTAPTGASGATSQPAPK